MGSSLYDTNTRSMRSTSMAYHTAPVDQIFTQNVERKSHKDMMPTGITFREARDSELHPNTVPIQFYLDVTGSMGMIPHEMIKDGLPTLMGKLIQNGIPDAALMFGAIGDHESDRYPLQVAQFESGDAELDMWLTRTYLEGNGGANGGESYLLAWYFASNHIQTDAFSKRGKKGFVFTVGDEPCLQNLPASAVRSIMGSTGAGEGNYTAAQLLAAAQKENHVYHIHVEHGGRQPDSTFMQMLGKNHITITDYKNIARVISDIILSHGSEVTTPVSSNKQEEAKPTGDTKPVDNML